MNIHDCIQLWDSLDTGERIAVEHACLPGKRAQACFARTRPGTVIALYRAGLLDNDAQPTDKAKALFHWAETGKAPAEPVTLRWRAEPNTKRRVVGMITEMPDTDQNWIIVGVRNAEVLEIQTLPGEWAHQAVERCSAAIDSCLSEKKALNS